MSKKMEKLVDSGTKKGIPSLDVLVVLFPFGILANDPAEYPYI